MKFSTAALVVALFPFVSAQSQCLDTYTVSASECSYTGLEDGIQGQLDANGCSHDALTELQLSLAVSTEAEVQDAIANVCASSYIEFSSITGHGDIFDKEYYDGGTYWNEARESVTDEGIVEDRLKVQPGQRIRQIYDDLAQKQGITWPDNLDNFENCEYNAAMCCFVQDRQAGDNNGNCATPYAENCVDADPADNVDICYVDMQRSQTSSRTTAGYAIFEGDTEDDSHCHGIAWADDASDKTARFKGNNLFYVSMYDHFYQRGYVRNVPGAPMCGCVEKMPVVTRADCTQIDTTEAATFTYSARNGLSVTIEELNIDFNSCQGADNNNNDLEAYYRQLVIDNKITQDKKDVFDETVVGKTYCREAIDSFLDGQGVMAKPECKYGYPQECGCAEVDQSDYRGNISTTATGLECQRWDSQTPHAHSRTRRNYPDSGLVENYCRNPDGEPGAWCYTTDPNVRWQLCDVPVCGIEPTESPTSAPTYTNPTCKADPATCGCDDVRQKDYRGRVSTTKSGKTCMRWDVQNPHSHTRTVANYPNAGLDENYCRNPDNEPGGAWCYTTDPATRWEYCDVESCPLGPSPTRALRGK